MTNVDRDISGEISLLSLGTTLLRHRWNILRWMLGVAMISAALVFFSPRLYVSSTSFLPQSSEGSLSGLASLAGQFGVTIPTGSPSQSPDFYATLLRSRVILAPIVRDSLLVSEMRRQRVPILDLLQARAGGKAGREDEGVKLLAERIKVRVVKTTGIVELSVTTQWPSVSLAIATALVNGLDKFNQETKQGQAGAERKFVEGRLAVAAADLRAAEYRTERFLSSNRHFSGSPELTFERERLQRAVSLQQQVFTSLTQAYEEARIREVRDTPIIMVVEPPSLPVLPTSKRVRGVLLGLLLGLFVGAVVSFISEAVAHRRLERDAEFSEFVATLGEARREMLDVRRWWKRVPR